MSRIRQIRESVDTKLNKLDAHADALESTLRHTEDHIRDRIERGKQEVHKALDALRADIDKSKQFSEAHKQKIWAEIDDLKVQIALGKAEGRDAIAAARKRFHEGARKVEAEVDSAKERADAAFDKRRQEMSQRIAEFKQRLGEKKAHTSERLIHFEEELGGGFEKFRKAFKVLFA